MMIVVVAIIIILVIILLATTTTTLRRVIQLPPRLPPRLSFLVEPALLRAQLSVPAQIRFLPVRLPILPALIRRRPAFHRPSTPIPAFASIDAAFPEPRVPGFRIDTFHLFRVFCNIRREDAIVRHTICSYVQALPITNAAPAANIVVLSAAKEHA